MHAHQNHTSSSPSKLDKVESALPHELIANQRDWWSELCSSLDHATTQVARVTDHHEWCRAESDQKVTAPQVKSSFVLGPIPAPTSRTTPGASDGRLALGHPLDPNLGAAKSQRSGGLRKQWESRLQHRCCSCCRVCALRSVDPGAVRFRVSRISGLHMVDLNPPSGVIASSPRHRHGLVPNMRPITAVWMVSVAVATLLELCLAKGLHVPRTHRHNLVEGKTAVPVPTMAYTVGQQQAQPLSPHARNDSRVVVMHDVRVTVHSSRLVRLEWSGSQSWRDLPSLVWLNRR